MKTDINYDAYVGLPVVLRGRTGSDQRGRTGSDQHNRLIIKNNR